MTTIGLLVIAGTLNAGTLYTNRVLHTLATRCKVGVASLDPAPDVTIDASCNILRITYRIQTNYVHQYLSKKAGDVTKNPVEEVGPSPQGLVLYVREEPLGHPNQLTTPQQTSHGFCDITPIAAMHRQLFWSLACGSNIEAAVGGRLRDAIRGMTNMPNKVLDATLKPAPSADSSAHEG